MRVSRRSGFTLVECAVAGFVIFVALSLLLLGGEQSRKLGQAGQSMANLRQYGAGTMSYAAEYQDRMWAFSWAASRPPSEIDSDLFPYLTYDVDSGTAQATQIIRRRFQRPTLQPPGGLMPFNDRMSMVLAEHMGIELNASWFVSPGDECQLEWSRNPLNVIDGGPIGCSGDFYRNILLPFVSSYEVGPAFYSRDNDLETLGQGPTHYQWFVSAIPGRMGDRRLPEVVFPSQKAMMWEKFARFHGTRTFYALMVGARVPVLMVDGSVSVRTRRPTSYPEGCDGADPRRVPPSAFYLSLQYEPRAFEPAPPNERISMTVPGFQRWTRYGLRGRDFDGPEIRTLP